MIVDAGKWVEFVSTDPGMVIAGYMKKQPQRKLPLPARGMFKRELGVARFVDLDHERHSALGAAKGEGLAGVLVGDGVQVLEVVIRTALDHAATKLGLLIRVVELDDGECDARIASRALRFAF